MTDPASPPSEADRLRQQAERALAREEAIGPEPDAARAMALVHELQVHQVELQIQNEQLQQTRSDLESSRDLYVRLYDFAPVGYATTDREGVMVGCNLTLSTLLGRERRHLVGRHLTSRITEEHRPLFLLMLQQICSDQVPGEVQISMQGPDGTPRWVLLRGQPVVGKHEGAGECSLSFTDITALRKAQEKLVEFNRDLEAKVVERTALAEGRASRLARLTSELARTEQRERQQLAQQLHDHLQQLLAGMGMRLDLLRRRHPPEDLERPLDELRQLMGEALETTRNLTLELSPPILRQGNLPDALHWLAEWVRQRHLLAVETRIDPDADPGRQELRVMLFEGVRELLFNVRKHAQVDRAELVARRNDGLMEVSVIDHGPGIRLGAGEALPTSGLGLFGLRERMEAFGGRLGLRRLVEGGTEATLVLPLGGEAVAGPPTGGRAGAAEPVAAPAVAPGSRRAGSHGPRRGLGVRIGVLLVDDHHLVRQALAGMISDEPDIEILGQATDGQEAVQMVGRFLPDVVVMDVSMPNMGGEQATQIIKELLPEVRIVALSMHDEQAVVDRMRRAGADTYVTKGCHAEELLAAIRG